MEEVGDISDSETIHSEQYSASEMEESDNSSDSKPEEETSNMPTQRINFVVSTIVLLRPCNFLCYFDYYLFSILLRVFDYYFTKIENNDYINKKLTF